MVVEKGDNLREIAKKLSDNGIIHNKFIFEFFSRTYQIDRDIKSGEYIFYENQSIKEILSDLSLGSVINNKIVVPEGKTSAEVIRILNDIEYLVGKIETVPAEGSIAPNTYFFSTGQTRRALLRQMQEGQEEIIKKIWKNRSKKLSIGSPQELLILASIIEKETGKFGERAIVSSVLHNRLESKMRLQADPTVIYGITKGHRKLDRRLLKADLKTFSEHNTYMISGLPKTPICNPGKDSLFAAANPAKTKFLYYVADGKGGHAFSDNLSQHNKNVRAWRKLRQRQLDD